MLRAGPAAAARVGHLRGLRGSRRPAFPEPAPCRGQGRGNRAQRNVMRVAGLARLLRGCIRRRWSSATSSGCRDRPGCLRDAAELVGRAYGRRDRTARPRTRQGWRGALGAWAVPLWVALLLWPGPGRGALAGVHAASPASAHEHADGAAVGDGADSRPPPRTVWEALRLLSRARRRHDTGSGRGSFVSYPNSAQISRNVQTGISLMGGGRVLVEALLQVRLMLEVPVAAMAADRRRPMTWSGCRQPSSTTRRSSRPTSTPTPATSTSCSWWRCTTLARTGDGGALPRPRRALRAGGRPGVVLALGQRRPPSDPPQGQGRRRGGGAAGSARPPHEAERQHKAMDRAG